MGAMTLEEEEKEAVWEDGTVFECFFFDRGLAINDETLGA
jgi:hypothetical protein